jgi:hypothetical protein
MEKIMKTVQHNVRLPKKIIGIDLMSYLRAREADEIQYFLQREKSDITLIKRKFLTAFLLTSLIVFLATL